MYDRKTVRRRRAVLALFLGLALVMMTAYFGESAGGGLHAVQRGAQEALGPIESGASRAFKPFRDLGGWFGDVLDAKKENRQLRTENERLRKEVARTSTGAREAEELRELVGLSKFSGYPAEVDHLTARVIARSPTVWYASVQIDKGSSDGVRENQPVVAAGGLVGKITTVTSNTARVTLLTDASSAVSAQVMPNGANGIVKPEVGDPEDLLLDFIQKGKRIRKGTTVVTSGFTSSKVESLFPRGIPIGKVVKAEPGEIELYQRVHIRPFADLRRLDFVQVLTSKAPGQRAEAGTQ